MYYIKGFSIVSILAVGGLLSAIFGFINWRFIVPWIIDINVNQVKLQSFNLSKLQIETIILFGQQIILKRGTDQFDRWLDIPQPLFFKVYIFNVSNPKEIANGEIPIVKEIGPFIYK